MTAPAGTLYRGREGMWSWVAHRVTGVLIFFFLFTHVLDTALVRVSPDDYDAIMATYKEPGGQPHGGRSRRRRALPRAERPAHHRRGLLVQGVQHQRAMLYGVIGLWLAVMVPGTWFMVERTVREVVGG